ncbi:MAG: metal-dependent hydrolase [Thiobacillus sp.]|uniref:metal-dependent hydrolase n=1 Tax=Thiobacillus sp. TaxID=924 RepID=UPI00168C4A15|nr:metal-dependent hydrolase [Thiobacillus sp.]QLQ01947.1 MAG: metal-dependent hydrolase [Thiobacillus sp.]
MFIAHLPAGYLAARLVALRVGHGATPRLVLTGMAGGVFPDIDLLYGALMDGGRIHHHLYWPHLPLVWASAGLLLLLARRRLDNAWWRLCGVFMLGAWSHLLLDSVAGDIWWLWPWLDTPFSLVNIPAIHARWWLNYLLHWSFAVELAIVALAFWWESQRPILRHWNWRPAS